MDRLLEMEIFVAVAEAGSLAGAGRYLRISPPAVTRAIASLEARLGARLFNRTTRSLSLTEVGERYLASAGRLLGDIETAEREAVGEVAVPQGLLSVTASVTFGRSALAPLLSAFLAAHPQVRLSVLLLDRNVNLIEEGIDVAVRIGALADSSLIARRVGQVRRVLVASPGYLRERGMPRCPGDLKSHAMIAFTGLMQSRRWTFLDGENLSHLALEPRLEINDASAAIAAAEAGDGITPALSYMVADSLDSGRLELVLQDHAPPPAPVHLVHTQSRLVAPKVRAFMDFAAPRLQRTLEQLARD